jgi:hypothetical protein
MILGCGLVWIENNEKLILLLIENLLKLNFTGILVGKRFSASHPGL